MQQELLKKANDLNKITGKDKFVAIAVGGGSWWWFY